jgi:hypothetical protein
VPASEIPDVLARSLRATRRLLPPAEGESEREIFAVQVGRDWDGYKVHYSETCDDDVPHLIVNVNTTSAALDDSTQVQPVHEGLAQCRPGGG